MFQGNDFSRYCQTLLFLERSGVDFVLFRAGLLTETGFYLVVYDNATRKNYLRVYEIANQRLGSFQEYPLPSFSPPAGSTYEMEPPVFLLPEKDSVRVVAGDLNALLSHKQLKICRIPDCSEVLEAIATPNGCVILGKLRKKNLNSAFFIESFPGRRTIVPYHAGVPWSLYWDQQSNKYAFHLARNEIDYVRMLAFDLSRNHNSGIMDFGSNNTEGRIPWSQIYYLNGYLDLLEAASRDTVTARVFAPILHDIQVRLELEMRVLSKILNRKDGYKTRAFTVDRSPALFAVQTSRLLLLYDRYQRFFPQAASCLDLEILEREVYSLKGHIEHLDNEAEYREGVMPSKKLHYLIWPRGCAFYFDGLAVPFNHQNEWAYSIFERAKNRKLPFDTSYLEIQRQIISLYTEHLMPSGTFPAVPDWHYWWGRAYAGYEEDKKYSIHMPSYPGDRSVAWISFRTIDVMSVLSALDFMPLLNREKIKMNAMELIKDGKLYPFAMRQLLESGLTCRLSFPVAHAFARSGAPWEIANQFWALRALSSSGNQILKLHAIYSQLLSSAPEEQPGWGRTDYPGNRKENVPKALAMLLKAELLRARCGALPELANRANAAAKILMEHADLRKDGFPGWGVPAAWDAYGDGTVNPRDTKYTISTAIVIDALLEWSETQSTSVRKKVISLCVDACTPYFDSANRSPSGLMPYSLELCDRPYDTFNPAAYMAGICQQLSTLDVSPRIAAQLRDTADRTMKVLLKHQQKSPSGNIFWHYSITEHVPNDLAHACYIIDGILRYARFHGNFAKEFNCSAITEHLSEFTDPHSDRVSAYPCKIRGKYDPPRSYDIGMAVNLIFQSMNRNTMEKIKPAFLSLFDKYYINGHMSRYPLDYEKPLFVREYECYMMLAVARVLWGKYSPE